MSVLPTRESLIARGPQLAPLIPYLLVPMLFGIGAATIPGYASKSSVLSLLVLSSLLGLASVGQTLCVIVGGVDLSIPAVIGLADVVITELYGAHWAFWEATLLILALALAIGVANAVISVALRVHPLVITLGTGLMVTGGVLDVEPLRRHRHNSAVADHLRVA